MSEKIYETNLGSIHYWTWGAMDGQDITLVFLPGLTADHRLFEKQVQHFAGKCNVLVWDPPGHGASWPFDLTFHLADQATWLEAILERENVAQPVIVGQSMGGYVGQAYAQLYPRRLKGFIAIDSAPLQRSYVTAMEIWLLKRMGPVYRRYPWRRLLKSAPKAVAVTGYGRWLMREMMMVYDGNQQRYAAVSGHGFRILAEAMEADLPYEILCPALLICGKRDRAGSCVRYNKAWHRHSGIPIEWIENAGHNANADAPQEVNALIQRLVSRL